MTRYENLIKEKYNDRRKIDIIDSGGMLSKFFYLNGEALR